VIEVPHCASIRDREREVIVLRSDNGQTWREHITPADDTPLKDTPTNTSGGILGQSPIIMLYSAIVPIWNSLPGSVVSAESVNSSKSRLDKFGLCMTLYMAIKPMHLLPEVKCNSYIISIILLYIIII